MVGSTVGRGKLGGGTWASTRHACATAPSVWEAMCTAAARARCGRRGAAGTILKQLLLVVEQLLVGLRRVLKVGALHDGIDGASLLAEAAASAGGAHALRIRMRCEHGRTTAAGN